jgi:hypothetical protein
MISTYAKDFSWEKKGPNSPSFQIKKNPNHHSLMINNFLKGSQEYRRIVFKFFFNIPSYLLCNQIWLNYFMDNPHFAYKSQNP